MSAKKASVVLKLLVVLIVLAAAGAAAFFYLRPVARVMAVKRGTATNIVPGSVVVDAERVSPIVSEVEGKVIGSALVRGQVVKEGEVLVRLDPTDIDLEIDHAQSEYDAAKQNIEIAGKISDLKWESTREDLANTERSYTVQHSVAETVLEKAKRDFKVAEQMREKEKVDNSQRLENLANTLKMAQRKKEKMTILAPFDGTIAEVLVHKNDFIGAKDRVASIIAQTRLVRAMISEEHFAAIQPGAKATVTFLGYPGVIFKATVTQKLPTAEADTQRYTIYLNVDIPPEKLLAGLTGDVGITLGEHPGVLTVPARAMWDSNVYVVTNGRVREQHVEPGYVDYNMVEVKAGLQEGDLVIVDNTSKFHDGQRIRVERAP